MLNSGQHQWDASSHWFLTSSSLCSNSGDNQPASWLSPAETIDSKRWNSREVGCGDEHWSHPGNSYARAPSLHPALDAINDVWLDQRSAATLSIAVHQLHLDTDRLLVCHAQRKHKRTKAWCVVQGSGHGKLHVTSCYIVFSWFVWWYIIFISYFLEYGMLSRSMKD